MNFFLIIQVNCTREGFEGTTQKNIIRQLRKRKISFTHFSVSTESLTNDPIKLDNHSIPNLHKNEFEIPFRQASVIVFIFNFNNKESVFNSDKFKKAKEQGAEENFEKHLIAFKQLLPHLKGKRILFVFQTPHKALSIINRISLRLSIARIFLFKYFYHLFQSQILFLIDDEGDGSCNLKTNKRKLGRAILRMKV